MDQEDQGDHNPPWWTRTGFYILLMLLWTMEVLGEVLKTFAEKHGKVAVRPLNPKPPKPKNMMRETERKGGVQLTERARVAGGHDKFSWY